MGDNISGRQTGAWCFCAVSVPAILTASRMGWGWALLAGAVAAAYFGLTGSLVPGGAVDLARETAAAFGRGPGRIVLALGGVFCVLALRRTISAEQFITVFTVVISFYFGTQSAKRKSGDDE